MAYKTSIFDLKERSMPTKEEKQKGRELIAKIDRLTEEKNQAIKDQNYMLAAELRDQIRAAIEQLEDLMNATGGNQ